MSPYKIDDVFISRRPAGGTGRWLKSGWKHEFEERSEYYGASIVLKQEPADGFIRELLQVEELGVMVTHENPGNPLGAVFPVRWLSAALEDEGIDWRC